MAIISVLKRNKIPQNPKREQIALTAAEVREYEQGSGNPF